MVHRIIALASGGKDSTFTMLKCVEEGHEVVALAHLHPPAELEKEEMDSYMYQTVGYKGVELASQALGLPLYKAVISGTAVKQDLTYAETVDDEVEDLYNLLCKAKNETNATAVCSGAIFSTYQKNRVEDVCNRLGLVSIAPLWEREQGTLLQEMLDHDMEIRIVKVATIGLGQSHVGQTARELLPYLKTINTKYGINICGEGGEFESFVTDCPIFQAKILITQSEKVCHSPDEYSPVWYEKFEKLGLEEKPELKDKSLKERLELWKNSQITACEV